MPTIAVPVAASGDDGRWSPGGEMQNNQQGMQFGNVTGTSIHAFCRFLSLGIPPGSIVTSAHVTFEANVNAGGASCFVSISGEASASPAVITSAPDADGRSLTTASAAWNPTAWTQGTSYDSPDLAAILNEVIALPGWSATSGIQLFFKDNGSTNNHVRQAAAFDHSTRDEPVLHVTYTEPVGVPLFMHHYRMRRAR